MEAKVFGHDSDHLKAEGWIPCAEKLPPLSQFVIYRTPEYVATGKLEEDTWFFSGHRLEPEKRPASADPSFAALWRETGGEEGIIQRTIRRWRGHGR